MNLYQQETYLNATEGHIFGESPVYETFTDDKGDLYRANQREYGRCTGRVFIDTPKGAKAVGWVFVSHQRYEDTNELYLREVWVTLHERKPETRTTFHYAN